MSGALSHLIAGSAMFIIGRYYFRSYFESENRNRELILLAFVCLSFSLLPDSALGIYYTTRISTFEVFLPYHDLIHIIFTPIAVFILLILKFWINTKRGPIWIMGLWSIVLHIIMDLFIQEHGLWI